MKSPQDLLILLAIAVVVVWLCVLKVNAADGVLQNVGGSLQQSGSAITGGAPLTNGQSSSTTFSNTLSVVGSFTGQDATLSGILTAPQHQYTTNTTTMAPDFALGYGYITTNAAFTMLAPINVVATKAETCVFLVTNSTAAAVVITPNVSWRTQGTWYVTNVSSVTVFHYGNILTNAICLPLF